MSYKWWSPSDKHFRRRCTSSCTSNGVQPVRESGRSSSFFDQDSCPPRSPHRSKASAFHSFRGRFLQDSSNIGRAMIRIEGALAWGGWLRVDHWPTAFCRHPSLLCGVLYHVANRTLSFHVIATDAVQLLLLLFGMDFHLSISFLHFGSGARGRPVSPRYPASTDLFLTIFRQCRSQRSPVD